MQKHPILGKIVTVTIDRPLGSVHPKHPDMIYPVNYGYIEGIIGGDGDEQDVYVIGVDEPVESFTGEVIAVIQRADDVEEKWVAAPEGSRYFEPQIRDLTWFTEQYFQSSYICLYEKSCGGVLYTMTHGGIRFVLIRNIVGEYGFPKGHIERGETEEQTALREICEETGIRAKIKDGFRDEIEIVIKGGVVKTYVHFLAEYAGQEIRVGEYEIAHAELVSYEQALERLQFPESLALIERAYRAIAVS